MSPNSARPSLPQTTPGSIQEGDYFSLPLRMTSNTDSQHSTLASGSSPLYRKKSNIQADPFLLNEAGIANRYLEASRYEADIKERIRSAYDGLAVVVKACKTKASAGDSDELITELTLHVQKTGESIPRAKAEIFSELEKFAEIAGSNRRQTAQSPSSKSQRSLKNFGNVILRRSGGKKQQSSDAASNMSQQKIMLDESESAFEEKKRTVFDDFSLQVEQSIIAPAEAVIARHVLSYIWSGRYEARVVLSEHPVYQALITCLISKKARNDFEALVSVVQDLLDRSNQAQRTFDGFDRKLQEEVTSFFLYLNDRTDSLRDSIKGKEKQGIDTILPSVRDTRIAATNVLLLREAERVLRARCQNEGNIIKNDIYKFFSHVFPEGIEIFDALDLKISELKQEMDATRTAYGALDRETQKELGSFFQNMDQYHQQAITSIRVAIVAAQSSFTELLRDHAEQHEAYVSENRDVAATLLKKKYRQQPPEGPLYEFIRQFVPEAAAAYQELTLRIVSLQTYIAVITQRPPQFDDPALKQLARAVKTEHQARLLSITASRQSIYDILENDTARGQSESERQVHDLVYGYLENNFYERVPDAAVQTALQLYSQTGVYTYCRDLQHRLNKTGPFLFTENISDPEGAELQKSLRMLYAPKSSTWREYEGLLKMNGQIIDSPGALMDMIANIAEGARGWRQLEGQLFHGAFETALIEPLLAYLSGPVAAEDVYQQTEFYAIGLGNLNAELKLIENRPEKDKLKSVFEEKQKKRFETKVGLYKKYVGEFEQALEDKPQPVIDALLKFKNIQKIRADAALNPATLKALKQYGEAIRYL